MTPKSPDKDWDAIEEAYRAGMPLREILARFGITMAALLARAKAGGWKWRDAAAQNEPKVEPEPQRRGADVMRLPVVFTPAIEATIEAVVRETAADIAASHKAIASKLRTRLELELAEFDEASKHFAQFRDVDHIARLTAQNDGGKELRAYLNQCLAHQAERAAMLERLSRIGGQAVDLERAVWGLDADADTASTWDDLLATLQKPLTPHKLPDNIINFERQLAKMRRDGG